MTTTMLPVLARADDAPPSTPPPTPRGEVAAALQTIAAVVGRLPCHLPQLLLGNSREAHDAIAAQPKARVSAATEIGSTLHRASLVIGSLEVSAIYRAPIEPPRDTSVDERERVKRIRDKCFAGMVLPDDMRAALDKFDAMLVRGEDVT